MSNNECEHEQYINEAIPIPATTTTTKNTILNEYAYSDEIKTKQKYKKKMRNNMQQYQFWMPRRRNFKQKQK